MDNDERISKGFLSTLYRDSEICFEPNGYKTYPDFICKSSDEYEVTGLYPISANITVLEFEKPILDNIERLLEKYNKNEYGYYLELTIDGKEMPSKNYLEKWFKKNDQLVSDLKIISGCLTIDLVKQNTYEDKYTLSCLMNNNGSAWLVQAHVDSIEHAILKKSSKMSEGATLILVNHVFPGLLGAPPQINNNYKFGIIVLDSQSSVQYQWPNKSLNPTA